MEINARELSILIYLLQEDKTSPLKSVKFNQIDTQKIQHLPESNVSISSLRRSLQKLYKMQLISYGIKIGKEKSYYITNKGSNFLNEAIK